MISITLVNCKVNVKRLLEYLEISTSSNNIFQYYDYFSRWKHSNLFQTLKRGQ